METPSKKCKTCGRVFYNLRFNAKNQRIRKWTKVQWKSAKFCSPECRYKDQVGKPSSRDGTGQTQECIICKKTFKKGGRTQEQWKSAKYCSIKCLAKSKLGVPRPDMVERLKKVRKLYKGEDHWNWKGGVTDENHRLRNTEEYKNWRDEVYRRDRWTCQDCGKKKAIIAHHIKSFKDYPALRHTVSNGTTLCRACHKNKHPEIGRETQFKKLP